MDYQIKLQLYSYFGKIVNPTEEELKLLQDLTESLEYYNMEGITKEDLKNHGFNILHITDEQFQDVADKCDRDWHEQTKRIVIPILAEGLPRLEDMICPKCGNIDLDYDQADRDFYCMTCTHEYSVKDLELYTLVQYPDDSAHLRRNNLGFPSYECEDSQATYITIEQYYSINKKEPEAHKLYVVMSEEKALESMEEKLLESLAEKIEDPEGIEAFGHDAYWVPACCLT